MFRISVFPFIGSRHLAVKKQMSQTTNTSSFYLHNINQISPFLLSPATERVNCRCHYHITSAVNIARLQRIHNSAARLILRRPRSASATPSLRKTHWLPIVCRVDFKLLVFTYTATCDAPVYLCELVCPRQPTRAQRAASSN